MQAGWACPGTQRFASRALANGALSAMPSGKRQGKYPRQCQDGHWHHHIEFRRPALARSGAR